MKRKYQSKSDDYLRKKFIEYIDELETYNNILCILPENSMLGRMSIIASINIVQRKIDFIKNEIENRNIDLGQDFKDKKG